MAIGREQAEQVVGIAIRKPLQIDLATFVDTVDELECPEVPHSQQAMHVGTKAAVAVEPMNRLRWNVAAARITGLGVGVGKKIGEDRDQIEQDDDQQAHHRELVLPEPPPCQLQLRGDGDAIFRVGSLATAAPKQSPPSPTGPRHASTWWRMRGSIHIRIRSDMKVPTTVSTPSSSTIVPARYMSWAINARSSTGPTVGRLSTSETIMLPETR